MSSDKKVTIRDVAEYLGVSISSVSRALNGHQYVSDDLRARVEAAARELGYEPSFLGHSLRKGTTNTIGFLVAALANPVIADIFEGIADALSGTEYAMTIMSSQNKPELDYAYLRFLVSRQVSGFLISSASGGPDQISTLLTEMEIPTVLLDRVPPPGDHIHAVQSDHVSGMRAATMHLLQQGHRQIAFIGGPAYFHPSIERLKGFYQALAEADVPVDQDLVRSIPFTASDSYTETMVLLARRRKPTALIVAGNIILVGVLSALQKKNVIVGRDIALIGCDDIDLTRLYRPPISVITRDLHQMGKIACHLLTSGMSDFQERVITLPTELVIRDSSNYSVGA